MRDPAPLDGDLGLATGLDDQAVFLGSDYGADDSSGGHDLITLRDRRYHLFLSFLLLPLWANE